jgi:hypothetical protein
MGEDHTNKPQVITGAAKWVCLRSNFQQAEQSLKSKQSTQLDQAADNLFLFAGFTKVQ